MCYFVLLILLLLAVCVSVECRNGDIYKCMTDIHIFHSIIIIIWHSFAEKNTIKLPMRECR